MGKDQKINVLIDTNILIRSSIQPIEREDLEKLIDYSQKGVIKLIVAEIVLDEIDKHKKNFEQKLNEEIGKVSKGIREIFKNNAIWNDLYDFERYLVDSAYNYKGEKFNLYLMFINEFDELTKSDNTEIVKPNLEKFYETQRKVINGEISPSQSNDTHLINCIQEISNKLHENYKLMMVTENKKDFFEADEHGNYLRNEDSTYKIKSLNSQNIQGFVSMKQLISYINKMENNDE